MSNARLNFFVDSALPPSAAASHAPAAASESASANRTEELAHTTFDAIKSRISQDNVQKKIKIRAPRWLRGKIQKRKMESRLFTNTIVKAKTKDAGTKTTRNLNIRSRINLMKTLLEKQGFDKNQIKLILCEYKMKLKEGGDVRDAESFFKYVKEQGEKEINNEKEINKHRLVLHEKQFETIVHKFNGLDNSIFEELDKAFVRRFSGKEKSVYVHDKLAVSTPKASSNPYKALKNKKVLKKEYEMTLDIRVNAMEKGLRNTNLVEKMKEQDLTTLLKLYRHALETNTEISNASSFFNNLQISNSDLYHKLCEQTSLKSLEELGKTIDQSISGIDTDRKKVVDQGKTYYKSARALGDLKYFLSSDKMKNLTLEEFTEFMKSFDDLQKSMKNAGLLHGDIKPDNIFVYEERTKEGRIIYKLKISDFGKSQLNTAKKMHTGNPRFHQGFYDTQETQQDSLNMIKLLILNSTTQLEGSQDTTEYANLLKKSPKISDIAYRSMDLGHHLHKEGITHYNYFSSATKGNVSASIHAWFTRKAGRDLMKKNTEDSVRSFLDKQRDEYFDRLEKEKSAPVTLAEKRKELQEKQLFFKRRQMSFELLQIMFPPEQDSKRMWSNNEEFDYCEKNILNCKRELDNLNKPPTKVAPTRPGKVKPAPKAGPPTPSVSASSLSAPAPAPSTPPPASMTPEQRFFSELSKLETDIHDATTLETMFACENRLTGLAGQITSMPRGAQKGLQARYQQAWLTYLRKSTSMEVPPPPPSEEHGLPVSEARSRLEQAMLKEPSAEQVQGRMGQIRTDLAQANKAVERVQERLNANRDSTKAEDLNKELAAAQAIAKAANDVLLAALDYVNQADKVSKSGRLAARNKSGEFAARTMSAYIMSGIERFQTIQTEKEKWKKQNSTKSMEKFKDRELRIASKLAKRAQEVAEYNQTTDNFITAQRQYLQTLKTFEDLNPLPPPRTPPPSQRAAT